MRFVESEIVELKLIVTDELKKEMVAFANTAGRICNALVQSKMFVQCGKGKRTYYKWMN